MIKHPDVKHPDIQSTDLAETPLSSHDTPSPSPTATHQMAITGAKVSQAETKPKVHRDATRYGDWELKGRCIDF